jgi:hypothetical protein
MAEEEVLGARRRSPRACRGSVEINRPLEEVFNYVSDVGNYPEWMAHALEVRNDAAGPPQQGDRFAVAIKSVGRRFETPYERIDFEANRRCTGSSRGWAYPQPALALCVSRGPRWDALDASRGR